MFSVFISDAMSATNLYLQCLLWRRTSYNIRHPEMTSCDLWYG